MSRKKKPQVPPFEPAHATVGAAVRSKRPMYDKPCVLCGADFGGFYGALCALCADELKELGVL